MFCKILGTHFLSFSSAQGVKVSCTLQARMVASKRFHELTSPTCRIHPIESSSTPSKNPLYWKCTWSTMISPGFSSTSAPRATRVFPGEDLKNARKRGDICEINRSATMRSFDWLNISTWWPFGHEAETVGMQATHRVYFVSAQGYLRKMWGGRQSD